MLVLGEKEEADGTITVRSRDKGDLGTTALRRVFTGLAGQ